MITYEKFRGYKYRLIDSYEHATGITGYCGIEPFEYVRIDDCGTLSIRRGYAWDGASGPTWDTRSNMRGSLVHDALYQLMRIGVIPIAERGKADRLFRDICIEDGMWKIRAWYYYQAVRMFGKSHAKPK
jgi:hypothetical protein